MTKFDFSVAMCVYAGDKREWFKRAVDSVISQTLRPSEVVVVVDGPVSVEIDDILIELENDALFKVVRLLKNEGHGKARKISLENCSNEFVAIMDSDDISLPDRFENQISIFRTNAQVDIVGGNITEFVGEENNIIAERVVPQDDEAIKKYMKKRCPMNQMTVMFKKSVYEHVGGYIDWYQDEDYYLWLRMMLDGATFANTGTILVNVRVGADMYKRRGGLKYFNSEKKLQKYMLKNNIIGMGTYFLNVMKRFIVQVLLPNNIRGWVFKKFARKSHSKNRS